MGNNVIVEGQQGEQGDESAGSICIKSEPVSDQEDAVNYNYPSTNNLNGSEMCAIPSHKFIQVNYARLTSY